MIPYYNHKKYLEFIKPKYDTSSKIYNQKLKLKDNPYTFLELHESLNVYQVYPEPIIMPLKRSGTTYDISLVPGSKLNIDLAVLDDKVKILFDTINELARDAVGLLGKYKGADKVRRFFDYELRDEVAKFTGEQRVTNAWVKIYELMITYDMFNTITNDTIKTFHVCEHPGKFINGIKYYVEKQLKKKHDFIYQSLRPGSDPTIFKPDPDLLRDYPDKLDYGPADGDITNRDNILYYREKYAKTKFNLITSDCGLDFSENYAGQETGLYKIFFCAFITALAVSSPGSNYIFKMFSFNDIKTIEFLYIVCEFYERVDLIRTLSTKSGSGENYCVCLNYNYAGNRDKVIDQLMNYMQLDNKLMYLVPKIDNDFLRMIMMHHELITMRRIVSVRSLLFRLYNLDYAESNPIVKKQTYQLTLYYVRFFMNYIKMVSTNSVLVGPAHVNNKLKKN